MKKNFFKKLSFVMALAMIVSIVAPAAGAFAATDDAAHLNATTKYLHLSATTGYNEFDFNIAHKQKGWKYAWTSADEDVATVDAASGLTTATGVGSTKVSVAITKGGKDVATLTADVIVKDNIKTVTIANAPKEALAVNATWNFDRDFETVSGSKDVTSSVTKWTVDKAEASIAANGLFKATAAGEYVVTALTFQSNDKYDEWNKATDKETVKALVLDDDQVKVTVAASMTDVKQADIDTVAVTFDSAMTDADKNLTVYQLVGTTEITQVLKEVKMDDAKKVASVSLYVPFTTGATYVIKYTGMANKTFVAATAKVEDVASLQVTTTTAVVNKGEDVAVKLFNKDGVDVTTPDLLNRVTYATSSERTYLNGKNLTIFTKGDTTTVTATFHTYKYDTTTGAELGNVTGTSVVTGVDAASAIVGGTTAWSINATGKADLSNPTHTVAAEDSGISFYVKLKQTTGSTEASIDNTGTDTGKFKFTSSNESVMLVYDNPTGGAALYPIKAGAVTIVVKYDDKVVDAIPVVVSPKRAAAIFKVDKNVVALSNAAFGDSAVVELSVKDQLNADFALADTKLEKLSGSPESNIDSLAGNKITFTGTGAKEGTYTYKVTSNGLAQIVTVTVTAPTAGDASYYRLALSSSAVDLKIDTAKTFTANTVTVSLFGYATNNIKTTSVSTAGAGYVVTVTNPDGTPTTLDATGKYTLTSLSGAAVSGSAIVKAKTGTYKVTVKAGDVVKDIVYFTVNDTQTPAKLDTVNTLVSDKSDLLAAIKQCFKFTLDGANITDYVVLGDYIGASTAKSVFVKTVKYTKTLSDGTLLDYTIAVNTNINKQ